MKRFLAQLAIQALSIAGGIGAPKAQNPLDDPPDPSDVQNILLWTMNSLGDVVRATPAIGALRERFADAHIAMVATPRAAPVLEHDPRLDDLRVIKNPYKVKEHISMLDGLRDRAWDLGVLLEVNPTWATLESVWCRRLGVRTWYTFDHGRKVSGSGRQVEIDGQGSWQDQFIRLAKSTGAHTPGLGASLHLLDTERDAFRTRLTTLGVAETDTLMVVHPGGAEREVSRQWASERFAEVIDRVSERWGWKSAITGVPSERGIVDAVLEAVTQSGPLDLCGRLSMRELMALLDRADVCVMNDTGPLHVAHAMGTRAVAILGPTGPEIVGIPPTTNVVRLGLQCSPCAFFTGWNSCSNPTQMQCLRELPTESVMTALERHERAMRGLEILPPGKGGAA